MSDSAPATSDEAAAPRRGSRRVARRAALQAVYQWLVSATESGDLFRQFQAAGHLKGADGDYFRALVSGVMADPDGLEALIAPYLDRQPEHLDPVERSLLLLAVFELRQRLEVPYRVVINEALELAKQFGAEAGHRYVNGVLDRCARELRPAEAAARG